MVLFFDKNINLESGSVYRAANTTQDYTKSGTNDILFNRKKSDYSNLSDDEFLHKIMHFDGTYSTDKYEPVTEDKEVYEIALKLVKGDFSAIDDIKEKDFFTVINCYSKLTENKSLRADIIQKYLDGVITQDEAEKYLKLYECKQYDFEYNNKNISETKYYFGDKDLLISFDDDIYFDFRNFCMYTKYLEDLFENNMELREKYNDIKQKFEEKYNYKLTDLEVYFITNHYYQLSDNLDFEEIVQCIENDPSNNGLENLIYNLGQKKTGLCVEAMLQKTEIADKKFLERRNFDINKSEISDLLTKSKYIREDAHKEFSVDIDGDIIKIYNNKTKEERIIDLENLTGNLNPTIKNLIKTSVLGLNSIMLWELTNEMKQPFARVEAFDAGGEYFVNNDTIGVNYDTSTYSLSHEIIHALMATTETGKNQFNEDLNEELLKTFEEEKTEFIKQENLEQCSRENWDRCQYAAYNIHEFAAESGCLYLLGTSSSQYTIAKYFPKSYRIIVSMIDDIRSRNSGRTI